MIQAMAERNIFLTNQKERKTMNKKRLLLVLLALAIITSLSAGTLAIYTKTVTTVDNDVKAKKFVFTANAAKTYATNFTLAPKDTWSYTFTVNNYDATATAEVALDYTVAVNDSEATTAMTGLKTTLEKKIGTNWVSLGNDTNGVISVRDDGLGIGASGANVTTGAAAANAQSTSTYRVTLTWNDDGTHDAAQTTQGTSPVNKDLKVTVTASQNTVSSNISSTSGESGTGNAQ
jgi:flagellar basal body-associated protein FliL